MKQGFQHLEELNIIRYMFYIEFDNHKWSRIILSRIHEGIFSIGDIPIMIDNDMIHKLTSLSNERCNPVNEKNVKILVDTNLKTKFDGGNM